MAAAGWRSDAGVSVAVDFSRHLDLIDDGLEGDELPQDDLAPAPPGLAAALADDLPGVFAEVSEAERERREWSWDDGGGPLLVPERDEPEPPPPPPPFPEGGTAEALAAAASPNAPAAAMR
jgi:hypothetical protein